MISCHINKNKYSNQSKILTHQSIFNSSLKQKTLKNSWKTNDFKTHKQEIKQMDKNKISQISTQVNDENCSYNANTFKTQNLLTQDCLKKQKNIFLHFQDQNNQNKTNQNQKKQIQANQVINLKKKIKKCSNHVKNSFFRQKVSFTKKMHIFKDQQSSIDEQKEKVHTLIRIEQKIETFNVYKDSQVFPGYRYQQFRNRIVNQRMDNDVQTDDEQIEKFVNKIKNEFLQHLQQVNKQKQQVVNKDNFIQEMNQ